MKHSPAAGRVWILAISVGALAAMAFSAAPSRPPGASKAASPAGQHKVTKGRFHVEVDLSGVFEARKMTEVIFAAEVLKSLKVVKCTPHGTRVTKGQTLVWADTQKVDRAIGEKAASVEAGQLALAAAIEELRRLEETTPQTLARLVEADRRAAQDLQRFTTVTRPLGEQAARLDLKTRADYLDYAKEELRQLKKMYEADDLTEETEEIVLRRQRDAVGRAEFALKRAQAATEQTLKTTLPRQAHDQALARKTSSENLASQKTLLPVQLAQKRLAVGKLKLDQARAVADLAAMQADRLKMTIKAPADGVLYYGQCVRGKWETGRALQAKLVPSGTITADEVIMTVVEPRALGVRAAAPEKQLHNLRAGLVGRATPGGYPQMKMKVKLASVLTVPLPGGLYDVKLDLTDPPGEVMPGMTCSIELTAYEAANALTVPADAVRADDADPDKHVVYVKTAAGSEKRPVKVGRTDGGKTEILSGLAEGDVVLLEGGK